MKRAAFELRRRFKERDISQNDAAKMIGCDSGNFSRILREDDRDPSLEVALACERVFGIAAPWWRQFVDDEGNVIAVSPRAGSGEHQAVDAPPSTGTDEG